MRIIAIDPGLDGVGIACFIDGKLAAAEGKTFKPEEIILPRGITKGDEAANAWIKRARREKPFDQRLTEITNWLVDRAMAFVYLNWVSGIPIKGELAVIEVPPPFTYGRTGDRNQWEISQLRMLTGAIYDRLCCKDFIVEGIYPLGWKGRGESAEQTIRRIKQALTLGAIPILDGFTIGLKQAADMWSAIGIGWKISTDREIERRII